MSTAAALKIRPLSDRIVVEALESESTTVKAIGAGKYVDGKIQPLQVKVGDEVLFGKYAGTNVKFADKEYLVMREEDVMGVIE